MKSTPSSRHLEQLFQDLEDGSISSEHFAELMTLLREDPAIRAKYRAHMEFVAILQAKADELSNTEEKNPPKTTPFPRKRLLAALSGLAALLVLSLALLIRNTPEEPSLVSISPGAGADWVFTKGGIATDRTDFLPDSKIHLRQGTLDINMTNDTEVLLEGPAELHIVNLEEVDLPYGRVWVRAGGDSFTVNTNSLSILDLGTEFGVNASLNLDEEVHVAKGKVRISPIEDEQLYHEFTEGSAARADQSGFVRAIPYNPSNFQTNGSKGAPYIHWSFDHSEEKALPSQQQSLSPADLYVYHLERRNKTLPPKLIPGRFGQALHLDEPDLFARASFPGISGNLPRTVSLWVKAQPQPELEGASSFLTSWGLATEFGTKWVLSLGSDQNSRIGTGWGGSWASSNVKKRDISLLDNEWHHLVFVFSGRSNEDGSPEIKHYIDGQPIEVYCNSKQPINTDCHANYSWPLTIGTQIFSESSSPTFRGALDELYIFRTALNQKQIEDLYLQNSLPDNH